MTEQEKELERVLKKIRYDRQMQRKRLYDQARRANKAKNA
jgi:hypothetical protein